LHGAAQQQQRQQQQQQQHDHRRGNCQLACSSPSTQGILKMTHEDILKNVLKNAHIHPTVPQVTTAWWPSAFPMTLGSQPTNKNDNVAAMPAPKDWSIADNNEPSQEENERH
jgi:hypothetical protein